MTKPSAEDLVRARLDNDKDFRAFETKLEDLAAEGFSAWDLSLDQGVKGIQKRLNADGKGALPSFIDEVKDLGDQIDDAEYNKPVDLDPKEIEVDDVDLEWNQTDETIQMHDTTEPGSMPSAACILIRNMVTRAATMRKINLDFVVARGKHFGISYNRQRFAAATIRMQNPKCTVLIFPTGIILTTGSKEKTEAREATEIVLNMLRQVRDDGGSRPYENIAFRRITVHNMVGSTFVNFRIDLRKLKRANSWVQFEPEEFRGASIKMNQVDQQFADTGITVLVFKSGGIVITGASSTASIKAVYTVLFPYLIKCAINAGLSLDERASKDRFRRAEADRRRAIAAGPNSEAVIGIDAAKQNQMLIEVNARNKNSLDLVPYAQRQIALSSAAGTDAPAQAGSLSADAHNVLAYHTYDLEQKRQDEFRAQRAERARLEAAGRGDELKPKRTRIMSLEEASQLMTDDL